MGTAPVGVVGTGSVADSVEQPNTTKQDNRQVVRNRGVGRLLNMIFQPVVKIFAAADTTRGAHE
ncbi:MAG: hypothetical protein CMJ59_10020 [Planctomycetaceae bacterium]|nr:hypothetical protein [Planctomycetaceae bacterium]